MLNRTTINSNYFCSTRKRSQNILKKNLTNAKTYNLMYLSLKLLNVGVLSNSKKIYPLVYTNFFLSYNANLFFQILSYRTVLSVLCLVENTFNKPTSTTKNRNSLQLKCHSFLNFL